MKNQSHIDPSTSSGSSPTARAKVSSSRVGAMSTQPRKPVHGALRVEPVRLTIEQWRKKYGHLLDETYNFANDWRRKDQVSPRDLRRMKSEINVEDTNTPGQVNIVRDATTQRDIPLWMNNDEAVRDLLIAQFPRIKSNQKRTAALWFHIILLFRQNEPASEIARFWNSEVGNGDLSPEEHLLRQLFGARFFEPVVDADYVRRVIQQIKFVASGLRTDGKPRASTAEISTAENIEATENTGLI